jgi:hypothetical protein
MEQNPYAAPHADLDGRSPESAPVLYDGVVGRDGIEGPGRS